MTKPLCIYHGNCADGFTAAWAVWKRFGDAFDYHAGVYQNPPPDVAGRHVILVDFSYKRPVLEQMAESALSVRVLDHHKTAIDDLAGYPSPVPFDAAHVDFWLACENAPGREITALFDLHRSGAGIAWDFFHPRTPRPRIVDYVEDRDLWNFELSHSREIAAALFSQPYTFEAWQKFATEIEGVGGFASLAREGAAIERKHHKDIAELVAVCKRRVVIGGVEVWAASLPYTLTSDAGNLMAQGEPFAACYWDTPDGRVFSLRSTPEGADVSEVAKQYGGGGHRNAAGFRIPLDRIAEIG